MKIALAFIVICMLIAGCNQSIFDDEIRKAVRKELKDPDSAKFENALIFQGRACVAFNAKNSYGGYSGITVAHLSRRSERTGGAWFVETLKGEPCDERALRRMDEADEVVRKTKSEIFQKLKDKKSLLI